METAITGGHGRDDHLDQAARGPDADGRYVTTVNELRIKFSDPTPKGGRVLEKGGFTPPGDFVLIQLMRHSSRSVGLDETVDLRSPGTETFRAFKSDRIFRFTFNQHGYEWGVDKVPEPELRAIGHVAADEILVLDRDGDDVDLGPDDVLHLGGAGTEHLHTEKRLITVFYENEPRQIPRGIYTTEELVKLFGVQAGYILEFINEEGQLTPLKPNERLRVKDGMKFFEQVPCGGSS